MLLPEPLHSGRHTAVLARQASSSLWLVVELDRPGTDVEQAHDPLLALNTPRPTGMAARAIHQSDLEVWYEVIKPVRVTTTDSEPVAADYSDIEITVSDGHRI